MTQKISGWTDPLLDMHPMSMAATVVIRANKREDDVPCVACIGEGRVFSEGEVRDMMERLHEELRVNFQWQSNTEVVSASTVRKAFATIAQILNRP